MAEVFDNNRPIYQQIIEKITHKIIAGEYQTGQRLPSVRELAGGFGVNPNTLQRAFAELERQGLLYTERTAGRFVTQEVSRINSMRNARATEKVRAFQVQMAQMGYTTAQLVALLQADAIAQGTSTQTPQTIEISDTSDTTEPTEPTQQTGQGGTQDE